MILVVALLSVNFAYAKEIKGVVHGHDENGHTPLVKATIGVLGYSVGTLTDSKGEFKLNLPANASKITVSYTGYEKDTIDVSKSDGFVEIDLHPHLETEEVHVYAEQPAIVISHSDVMKTETITGKGLKKAACCNLAESFETSPSVDVEYSDAVTGAKRIQLLGLAGTYSQILTEKVPNLRGLGSVYGLNFIPGPWMESIQVSKGSASVTTGYESMTGQINVEFKKPEKLEPLFLNLYGDLTGRAEANVDFSTKVTDELSTMLLLHGDYFNNQMDDNKDKFIDKPLVSQFNVMNRWKYQGEHYESVTMLKGLYEDRKGGQKDYFPDKNNTLYGTNVKTQRYEFSTKNGYIFSDEPFKSLGTIVSAIHHNQDAKFGNKTYNAEQNSLYINLLYQAELGHEEHSITGGASMQYDNYIEDFDNDSRITNETVPGVYAEYTYSGIKDLTFIAGLRADFHNEYDAFITPRFHLKYSFNPTSSFRASAGKGYRTTHVYAENIGILASARTVDITQKLDAEEAWNYGLNFSHTQDIFGMDFNFNAEYYRTDFLSQVIMDMDTDPSKVMFYNLDGKSYSNSFQIDVNFEPFRRFVMTTAYRLNDVKQTINGKLEDKPLQSRHKAFLNLMYDTEDNGWNFDFTLEYNGEGRLPNTSGNPVEYQLKDKFPAFAMVNAQVTKRFETFDIYIGGENLTDYKQSNPILAANDPFGTHFDSSMIWGPVSGRMIYMGVRMKFD